MNFHDWLMKQVDRDDPVGDLARDVGDDKTAPVMVSFYSTWNNHLINSHACIEARVALADAFNEYREASS